MPSRPSPAARPKATPAQRLAFAGAAALFVGWLCWLGYLGLTAQTPVVLSRPQFLISAVDVIVTLEQVGTVPQQAAVKQVLWSGADAARGLANTTITISNLDRCVGWDAPGEYLIPLVREGANGPWHVPGTPRSPGFEPDAAKGIGLPRIYPVTPQILAQYATLAKP